LTQIGCAGQVAGTCRSAGASVGLRTRLPVSSTTAGFVRKAGERILTSGRDATCAVPDPPEKNRQANGHNAPGRFHPVGDFTAWPGSNRNDEHSSTPRGQARSGIRDYERKCAALSVAHSRKVCAGAPVISATVEVTCAGWPPAAAQAVSNIFTAGRGPIVSSSRCASSGEISSMRSERPITRPIDGHLLELADRLRSG
jgi:hypothetical protein